jgi:hypothetical protein
VCAGSDDIFGLLWLKDLCSSRVGGEGGEDGIG